MIKIIRNLLSDIIDRIDSGNSNLDEDECKEVIEYLTFMSKTSREAIISASDSLITGCECI